MRTTPNIPVLTFIGCLLTAASGLAQSGPPVITQDLISLTVAVGQNATFTVAATNGPLTFQWQTAPVGSGMFNVLSDGGQISGSSGPSLTISNVTPANAADFRVVVANGQSAATSSVATLTVELSYALNLAAGLSLIANQLDHGSNTLNEIMPSVPGGSILYKFNNAATNWSPAYYSAALGVWNPPGISLKPGEGAFFQSPTNFTLNFTGVPHVPVLPVSIPAGACYLFSRQTNDLGNYANIVGLAPNNHAAIYQWNGSGYTLSQYEAGTWTSGGSNGPTAAVGEALWISPSGGSGPAPLAVPPVIASRPPAATVVGLGSNAVLSVSAAGLPPFQYQWYKNTVPIAGATASTLAIASATFGDTAYYSVAAGNAFGVTYTPPSLLRVAEIINTGGGGNGGGNNITLRDFGDMPSTNWSCWETSYFDANAGCSVRSIFSTTESIPPLSYPTTLAQNGARNSWNENGDQTWLGTDVSPTTDGVPNAQAMGDPAVTNLLIGDNSSLGLGDVFTPAGYVREENGIRMIPSPFLYPTNNQIVQRYGLALDQSQMIDPRLTYQGLLGNNLFGSPKLYFVPGQDTNYEQYYTNYQTFEHFPTRQVYAPGQILWFVVEAYNKDNILNYSNGVSYLNVWVDYGNSNGPAGPADGVFQTNEYVVIDQPLYGADMLQTLSVLADYPYDTGGTTLKSGAPVTQVLADEYGLSQPVPAIGVQPYASNGLQVVSFRLPDDLGDLTCGKQLFVRFRISSQPLNLWRIYDPSTGSAHVLDPISGPAPTGPGYNPFALLNSSGQPDPSLGEVTGGGEVEDYPLFMTATYVLSPTLGVAPICGKVVLASSAMTISLLPVHPPTTKLAQQIDDSQTYLFVTVSNNWPAPPFTIEVGDPNGLFELMLVTNAPIGTNVVWMVQRDTPACTINMPFSVGTVVTLAQPCQCQINAGIGLPSGLVNVTGTDPGPQPCNRPFFIIPDYPGWGGMIAEQYPDQFLFANTGSNSLSGVTITYTVPTNAMLETAVASQGTLSNFAGAVSFALGALDPGQTALIGIKLLPFSTSGPTATFLHHFDFSADQPLLGATTFEAMNTVRISTILSIVAGSSNSATLLWTTNSSGVTLQQNSSLVGPWSNAPVQTPPYTFSTTNPAQFFRLTQ